MLIAWPYFTLVYCHGWRRDPCTASRFDQRSRSTLEIPRSRFINLSRVLAKITTNQILNALILLELFGLTLS